MKVMLIGVPYVGGKYTPTKAATAALEAAGHEVVTSLKEDVTVALGKLMPFSAPKKPDVLLKAESMKLSISDLDALLGVQTPAAQPKPEKKSKRKAKAKGKRAKKEPLEQAQAA